jgi:serine/threonine protein kinase
MGALTEPIAISPVPAGKQKSAREWLDALSAGTCDQDTFLRAVSELFKKTPDASWEVLALLDQYYRRGKIQFESFQTLQAHLQSVAIGVETNTEISVPLPQGRIPAREAGNATPIGPARARLTGQPASAAAPAAMPPAAMPPAAMPPAAMPPVASTPAAAVPAARPTARPAAATPAAPAPPAAAPTAPATPPAVAAATPVVAAPPAVRPPAARPTTAAPWAAPPGRESDSVARDRASAASREQRPDDVRAMPAVGDLLRGRYRLQRVLGKGGKGTVFEAVDEYRGELPMSSQVLAVKVLHSSVIEIPELLTELRREFRHLQSLSHPNIVRVHEFDRDGDTAFFTMELLSGALLSNLLHLKHGVPLDRPHAFEIIRDVGDALVHAHSRGVVHGDISPQNIFVTDEGDVRILDFGAAHTLTTGPWISDFDSQPQFPVASPSYASCELLEGQRPDARDDLYALACVAYVLLTGDLPFKKRTAIEARTARLSPRRPSGLSGRQWQALRKGLSLDRDRRPSDLDDWLRRLEVRKHAARLPALSLLLRPSLSRRRFRVGRALTVAAVPVLAVVLWAATDFESPSRLAARLSADASLLMDKAGDSIAHMTDSAPGDTETDGASGAAGAASGNTAAQSAAGVGSGAGHPRAAIGAAATAPVPEADAVTKPVRSAARAAPVASDAPAGVGNQPLARIEFAQDTTEVLPGDPIAQVTIRRKGNLRSDATFTWWTESGTAKSGIDFVGVAPRVEHIEAGKDRISLIIPVVYDSKRRQTKNFYAVIDQPGPGASLGARTLAMVTIVPSD